MTLAKMGAGKRRDMGAAAMRAYPRIIRDWDLPEQDAALLLGVADSTYRRWRKDPTSARFDVNHLERMSLIMGIYKTLKQLLPRSDAADSWLRRPNKNPLFAGHPPIERLRSGQVSDLYVVRQHLDAARKDGYT